MTTEICQVTSLILGLVVGSFLNVVVYRLPRRVSRVGSRCRDADALRPATRDCELLPPKAGITARFRGGILVESHRHSVRACTDGSVLDLSCRLPWCWQELSSRSPGSTSTAIPNVIVLPRPRWDCNVLVTRSVPIRDALLEWLPTLARSPVCGFEGRNGDGRRQTAAWSGLTGWKACCRRFCHRIRDRTRADSVSGDRTNSRYRLARSCLCGYAVLSKPDAELWLG